MYVKKKVSGWGYAPQEEIKGRRGASLSNSDAYRVQAVLEAVFSGVESSFHRRVKAEFAFEV